MENLEIIVLTIIISTLFIIFILGPVFYAHKLQDNSGDTYRSQKPQSQTTKTELETIIANTHLANTTASDPKSNVGFSENSDQNLQNLLSSLLKNPNLSATSKLEISLALSVAIQEMESNGIQFPIALKNSLIESIKPTNPA
jgi:hypothetical protein